MAQLDVLKTFSLAALLLGGYSAVIADEAVMPEIVQISRDRLDALIAAPRVSLRQPPSADLANAMVAGTFEKTRIEEFGNAYQGWIVYDRKQLSDSRLYRPQVVCISNDEGVTWPVC
jgi:hypothetical protein